MMVGKTSNRRSLPLAAAFAAIYGTLRLVPFSLWIGLSGRAFTATEFFAPLFGIILGPYVGSVTAIVGTFIAILLTGRMNFFGLDFLPVLTNALVLGFLIRRKWSLSFLTYSVLLALFFVHPMTLRLVSVPFPSSKIELPFPWLHMIAWILLGSPLGRKSVDWIHEATIWKATCAACILTIIGTTAQHLAGTILFATLAVSVMGLTPEALAATWNAVFYIYPVERLIVIFAGTILTATVTKTLVAARLLRMSPREPPAISI